ELLCDVLGNQRGIEFRLTDFDDIELHFILGELGEVFTDILDVGTLLTDDDARASSVDGDVRLLAGAFDHDSTNTSRGQRGLDVFADLEILMQAACVVALAREPTRVPSAVNAKTKAYWIDFLTHGLSSFLLTQDDCQIRKRLEDASAAATATRMHALH